MIRRKARKFIAICDLKLFRQKIDTIRFYKENQPMMTFICYAKCNTCKKAQAWLTAQGKEFEVRDIKEQNPTEAELRTWHDRSGLPLKKFFNTSGLQYKALDLKTRLPDMTEDEQFALLASDGMLVKRPILLAGDRVLVGFKEAEWAEVLG